VSDIGTDGPVEGSAVKKRSVFRDVYQSSNDFNFIKTFKVGLAIGAFVSVVSIISLFALELNLGIDFEGGSVWEVPANGASVEDAREVMTDQGESGAKIQTVTDADGTERLRVQSDATDQETTSEVTRALAELGGVETDEVSLESVGPSWGDEITDQAIRALIIFFIAITIYMSWRLEWRMAVGALVSMIHDLLLSIGVYSILQLEVTPATLISFLTILGYSLYDTIVVFDRALEIQARTVAKTPYRFIMNRTLNQTLMRSVNTTLATILPIISMLVVGSILLGAETLEEFALALLVGLTSGAYSSLFVAAPLVVFLKEREPKWAYSGEEGSALAMAAATPDAGSKVTPRPARKAAAQARRPAAPAAPTGAIPPRPRKTKKRR
jgi:preprotein translocase subunit SecF